jgi:pimeloyl-ACP methyl ester carboxylesterase
MTSKPHLRVVGSETDPGFTSETHLLPAQGQGPALEWIEAHPLGAAIGPPILFLHGAFGGAWMWNEVYLPFFARRGRHVAAVSLRAHGRSGGGDRLQRYALADYREDVERAIREFPVPPIVVGHSLGGLLAQMLVGRISMRALVLLASLPPDGLFFESPRLAITDPHIWAEAVLGSTTNTRLPIAVAGYQVLFSEGLPSERVERYASRMQPESARALLEAHLPGPIVPALLVGLRTLVYSGDKDRLVGRASSLRTAFFHGAEYRTDAAMGHFFPLDVGAEDVARQVLDWIEAL